MTALRLIADDLTGALDSAVQFTGLCGPVPVRFGLEPGAPSGTFALDLNCRDGSEDEAVARTRATAAALGGADLPFKKIDSLLRGFWAAELAALAAFRLFDRIVLAPAFPAQGRTTREGRQWMRGDDRHWHRLPVDPGAELTRRGLQIVRGLSALPRADAATTPVLLCDAEHDDDLAALVRAARGLPGTTLWCGSAGLARALAAAPPETIAPSGSPHLVLVGSNHAVSWSQIGRIRSGQAHCLVHFDTDPVTGATLIDEALVRHGRCVAAADLPPGLAAADAMAEIEGRLGALLPRIGRPAVLTVVGGETFAAVCRALAVEALAAEGEWRPGVPASRMRGGLWDGTRCFSKSGAFGNEDLLADLLGTVAASPTV